MFCSSTSSWQPPRCLVMEGGRGYLDQPPHTVQSHSELVWHTTSKQQQHKQNKKTISADTDTRETWPWKSLVNV